MYTPTATPKGATEPYVQMASRLPLDLLREIKMHCVATNQTLTAFLAKSLRAQLRAESRAEG